jgi:hypothetical protein
MIEYETALDIALEEIFKINYHFQKRQELRLKNKSEKNRANLKTDEIILLEEETIEKKLGWIFFYNSKFATEFHTKNPNSKKLCGFELGGNAPFIVDRFTKKIHYTGTADSIENYIETYEKENEYWVLNTSNETLRKKGNLLKLKRKLQLNNEDLIKLKKEQGKIISIKKGGRNELNLLKNVLHELEIETQVIWNNKNCP